jgi:hypothetical protein
LESRSLAVHPYTEEEMRRIMIVENMTQRGYENFGAVMDSVAAVIVAIVRECFLLHNSGEENKDQTISIKAGRGVGAHAVHDHEPSISRTNSRAAIDCLKASGNPRWFLIINGLETSGVSKCSICSQVSGNNFEFVKLQGCFFFDDLVALCHAVPLTRSSLFTYNLLSTINIRARQSQPAVRQDGKLRVSTDSRATSFLIGRPSFFVVGNKRVVAFFMVRIAGA